MSDYKSTTIDRHSKGLPSYAQEFVNYRVAVCSPPTVSIYITCLRKLYGLWKTQGKDPEKFFDQTSRAFFEQWLNHMYVIGNKAMTRRSNIKSVRFYLCWAYERGYLKLDPHHLIQPQDLPKEPKHLPKPLQIEQDKILIDYLRSCSGLPKKGLLLARFTGMRIGELLNLPYDCLRFDDDGSCSLYVPPGKMLADRLVPLTKEGVALVKHMQHLSEKYDKHNLGKMMVSHQHACVYSYAGMRSVMSKSCIRAGIAHYSIHQLRHTFATSLLNAGVSIITLKINGS